MPELVVIVPTRSRPEAVSRVVDAWEATGAGDEGAELLFVVDTDDPQCAEYRRQLAGRPAWVGAVYEPMWRPLVPKLNRAAISLALGRCAPMLGFAGDDHLPRTPGWVGRYLGELYRLGTGVVYCDDGYQHENIPTQWAMTADIVRGLGRMVPGGVDHLYCDNVIRDLARAAGCLSYLPDVLIEHMHPVARDATGTPKAPSDEQYERVNGREQNRSDRAAYRWWKSRSLADDAAKIIKIREQAA